MTSKRFRVTITLQEDMHSGTGMGGSVIDACQFRDREGKPRIRRTHLKGLLRDAAEELVERHPGTRNELREKVDQLFGTAGKSVSPQLLFHSLRLEN
ncbi:MAG TPA: RAMP superfamily CRISPR-associated protein, partial [bacterium]|nr:RAMP superfamily CRISPR-associated protein [bacterium]